MEDLSPGGRSPVLRGKRILLCEDEGLIVMQLQRALTRAGLIVCGAESTGEGAVAAAAVEAPDIVLMDVGLPGISGIEAARRIIAGRPACVVLLTGQPEQAVQEAGFAAGALDCLLKPVDCDTLVSALERAFWAFAKRADECRGSRTRQSRCSAPAALPDLPGNGTH